MTGHRQGFLSRITPLIDLALAFIYAYYSAGITNRLAPIFGWEREVSYNLITSTPFLAGAALVGIPFILQLVGFYHKNSLQRASTALRQIITFSAYYFVALFIYQSISDESVYRNHVLLVNAVGIPCLLYVRFLLTRFWMLHTNRGRRSLLPVILAGREEDVESQWNQLPPYWKKRFRVAGTAIPGKTTEQELQAMIEEHNVSHLVVCGGLGSYHLNEYIINICELQGIDVHLMLDNAVHPGSMSAEINVIQNSRMLTLSSRPSQFWARLLKSVLDRIVAALILTCSLPLWIFAAIGIKISDPKGKIFYRQQRSGLYGKPFGMWKFRSMYSDAEQRLAEVKAKYGNEMNGPIFKLTNDPRIFPFGHLIRKLSIDELPQLLNIIAGDMSIVGPRPLPVYETAEFPSIAHRRRLSVKPGLTCYWQIEDRSDNGDFDNMINKDVKYIDNWSLWLDVVLFFRTIPAVLFGKGAK